MSVSDVRNLFLVDADASSKNPGMNRSSEKLEEGEPKNESVSVVSNFTSNKTNSVENATKFSTFLTHTKEKNMLRHKNNKSNTGDSFILESNLYESIDSLSVIGFRHCFDSNRTSANRLLWSLLILASIGVAIFQCNDRVNEYLKSPTSTVITVNQSTILNFPQVTICNNNYIKLSAATDLGLTSYFKQFMPPFFVGTPNASTCMWNKKPCKNEAVTMRFTDFGQCLYIDSRAMNFTITRPGATLGIQLLLNANETDYFIQQTSSVGYTVLLHEPDEPPRMAELGFKANLGEGVSIAVSVTKTSILFACFLNYFPPEYLYTARLL
ncbi:hypothetical protein HELRODRAFT_180291 [Helobdella robusta]|uniref:Uncharacterized protein n=1 Tax=Helobdella robusta TaxID=6412 RepID=T1FFP5_HELRO|nr:hypothetical protein HELRODRAFT_180291 [Helobdella robusta]ESN94121.1 hypothetical protein HELRODRAFT_180291 [Helobdella robusta]